MSSDKEEMEKPAVSVVDEVACAGLNETAEMSDADGEQILTMQDVLDEQDELEKEYAAVLGGSDHKCCTYSKGYIKRQALYACLTCTPEARTDPEQRAGVCLACSYNCHVGHDMVELYTKRAFRCDCGTSKILAVRCRLDPNKPDANDANLYNQNFSGVYCFCHRPYPDAEDPIDDEMIQCVVCEDWFHCRHLETKVPPMNDFSEMICGACMIQNDFLQHYNKFSVTAETDNLNGFGNGGVVDESSALDDTVKSIEVDIGNTDSVANAVDVPAVAVSPVPPVVPPTDAEFSEEINQCINDIIEINKSGVGDEPTEESSLMQDAAPPSKKQKLNDATEKPIHEKASTATGGSPPKVAGNCRKPAYPSQTKSGATFWPHDWRLNLCDCTVCRVQMQRKRVEFLLDAEDTVLCYQEKGMAKVAEGENMQQDVAMAALSALDRGSQIDAIMGYNRLREKLTEFLNAFAASRQVVTEEDIKRFFKMMKERQGDEPKATLGGSRGGSV